jgi:formylglycine-generating enzyme required for sulfatase activity
MAELHRYAAFISYSSKDAAFARRLHRALESYGIPSSLGKFDLIGGGKKNRIYPVFRDREELSAGHLGDQIEANLRASAALIVVCSPNGAASPWVQKEIEFFAEQGRLSKIFAIIPDNAPLVDENGVDATQSCFPPAFLGDALIGDKLEPLAADARRGKDGFRSAWLKVVAGLIGVSPGKIIDRDKKRQVRQRLVNGTLALGMALFLAVATQSTWRPALSDYLRYQRFAHSTAELSALRHGAEFQDCAPGAKDCPVMVVLPKGQFMMGSADNDPNGREEERPIHSVSVAKFAVSKYNITTDDWQVCVDAGGCSRGLNGPPSGRAISSVSWHEAREYALWLSSKTGKNYRLLSEAEWEYAARGVTTLNARHTRYYWGDDEAEWCDRSARNGAQPDFDNGDCGEASGLPVGSYLPNPFGLYDMAGGVDQWVQDCAAPYDATHHDATAVEYDGSTPNTTCGTRVLRGGSSGPILGPFSARGSASRAESLPSSAHGFRVARTL